MFSAVIKELRLQKGLTQRELAQAVYISPGAISQYEKGRAKPSRDTLESLAAYFGVSVNYLLGSSANREIESLLAREFTSGVSMCQFVRLCDCIDPKDRDTIYRLICGLVSCDGPNIPHKTEKVCR